MAGSKKKPTRASDRLKAKSKSANVSENSEDSSSSAAFDEEESFNSSKELEHAFNKINSKNKKDDTLIQSHGDSPLSVQTKFVGEDAQGTSAQCTDTIHGTGTNTSALRPTPHGSPQLQASADNMAWNKNLGDSNVNISGSSYPHASVGNHTAHLVPNHLNSNAVFQSAQQTDLSGSHHVHQPHMDHAFTHVRPLIPIHTMHDNNSSHWEQINRGDHHYGGDRILHHGINYSCGNSPIVDAHDKQHMLADNN